jgi:hypothetical protein
MPFIPGTDAQAGGWNPFELAKTIHANGGWIYRICNEILARNTADGRLLVSRAYELARKCRQFCAECNKARDGSGDLLHVRAALAERMRQDGGGGAVTEAEVNAVTKSLYDAAGSFATWAQGALPDYGATIAGATTVARRVPWRDKDGNLLAGGNTYIVEIETTVPMQAQFLARVTTLRAEFP